jgi:hypothetical protein
MPLASPPEGPRIVTREGRIVIETNWDDADSLRDHFVRHGLPCTVNLDPESRSANLELWDDPSADDVQAVLAEWM